MKNQIWMMIICCLLPALLFFVAPALGMNKDNAFFIFIPIMILVCFMMMGKGGCCGGHKNEDKDKEKEKNKEQQGCH